MLPLLAAMPLAHAQDEEPLRPEEAYRYVVTDTGNSIEVDWAIEKGYYLYRKELAFESNTAAVVLSNARLPEGQPHEDEYFGKQQVYREHFYVTVPYRIEGKRPEGTADCVIRRKPGLKP
jgi:thiol:disulfide interchange protein DsbD